MLLTLTLLIFVYFMLGSLYADVDLARGRCGVSGAQVAHVALWPLVIMLVACIMIILYILYVLNMLCFDCCPGWTAMWLLIVCYETHIFMCVKCSLCISKYIQMHEEQSYCECLTVLICILLWMVSNGLFNLHLHSSECACILVLV